MPSQPAETVRYDVCVQQGFEVWGLGSVDVLADSTPEQANQHVVDLLRRVADDLERESLTGGAPC
jgi:hypothetical protein